MVSNGGQIIRVPVDGISIYSRSSRGVRVFNTAEDEQVVSVSRLRDVNGDEEEDEEGEDGEVVAVDGAVESEPTGEAPVPDPEPQADAAPEDDQGQDEDPEKDT